MGRRRRSIITLHTAFSLGSAYFFEAAFVLEMFVSSGVELLIEEKQEFMKQSPSIPEITDKC
jgi:hypothetical protein